MGFLYISPSSQDPAWLIDRSVHFRSLLLGVKEIEKVQNDLFTSVAFSSRTLNEVYNYALGLWLSDLDLDNSLGLVPVFLQ